MGLCLNSVELLPRTFMRLGKLARLVGRGKGSLFAAIFREFYGNLIDNDLRWQYNQYILNFRFYVIAEKYDFGYITKKSNNDCRKLKQISV